MYQTLILQATDGTNVTTKSYITKKSRVQSSVIFHSMYSSCNATYHSANRSRESLAVHFHYGNIMYHFIYERNNLDKVNAESII